MLFEVFRYPDETERRANTGQLVTKGLPAAIPSFRQRKRTSRRTALISPVLTGENRTVSGSLRWGLWWSAQYRAGYPYPPAAGAGEDWASRS